MKACDFKGYIFDIEKFKQAGYDVITMRKYGSQAWMARARQIFKKSSLDLTKKEIESVPLLDGENIF